MMKFYMCIIQLGAIYQFVTSVQHEETSNTYKPYNETVLITPSSNIKNIQVPTSNHPLLTWMEIRKGKFPNVTRDTASVTNVTIGDPVTLFIFHKDDSNLYDIKVTDCWAYDDENFSASKQKLHLTQDSLNSTSDKVLITWRKVHSHESLNFLYASFTSFKFPEKDRIYLTCDIQLVGKEQEK